LHRQNGDDNWGWAWHSQKPTSKKHLDRNLNMCIP
jgi:hypothetical protein